MKPVYLGVDPGLTGALAWVDAEGRLLWVEDMPLAEHRVGKSRKNKVPPGVLRAVIENAPCPAPVCAAVEAVHAMPGQGVSSMFTFGMTYGVILGVLAGMDVRVQHVRPQEWKSTVRLPKSAPKGAARALAADLFPAQAHLFKRVKDDGRADAALIALWLAKGSAA